MASLTSVKDYLACWLQLGRSVVVEDCTGLSNLKPQSVLGISQPSQEFEQCWQTIQVQASQCHLEGTDESIAELLTDQWDITACSRCQLPVAVPTRGISTGPCPCADLDTWPNSETVPPRPLDRFIEQQPLRMIQSKLIEEISGTDLSCLKLKS